MTLSSCLYSCLSNFHLILLLLLCTLLCITKNKSPRKRGQQKSWAWVPGPVVILTHLTTSLSVLPSFFYQSENESESAAAAASKQTARSRRERERVRSETMAAASCSLWNSPSPHPSPFDFKHNNASFFFFPVPTPKPPLFRFRCNLSVPSKTNAITLTEPQPLFTSVKTFAPATVANLGPGFDFLGCAVDGLGDTVSLSVDPHVHPGEVSISHISGNNTSKLSKNPLWNCAGIAAIEVMKMLGIRSVGLSLSLEKGLPLGSGLGSSAASAAAAAVAVNEIFGNKLGVEDLVLASLKSEEKVSGYHADNVGPAIMGGFVLIRSYEPLELIQLKFPSDKELFFVLVTPEFEAPTKKMRAALPTEIGMPHHVWNCSQAGALVASVLQGDIIGLGKALSSDKIVEPRRAPLIPGMEAVKRAALDAGAFGCTISGAGPTAVAVIDDYNRGAEIGQHMVDAFFSEGNLKAVANVKRLDRVGARLLSSTKI